MEDNPPSSLWPQPDADALRKRFVGKSIEELPTPAVIIDRALVAPKCAAMLAAVQDHWQCRFRAHIKTHKTAEATRAQVGKSRDRAIVFSTLAEGWGVVKSGLVGDGTVKDMLYGVPIAPSKVAEFLALRNTVARAEPQCELKALVDHPDQVGALKAALAQDTGSHPPLRVFIKIECGYRRAGVSPKSPVLDKVVHSILSSPRLAIDGVYCHGGFSYNSRSASDAESCLSDEMLAANEAAAAVTRLIDEAQESSASTSYQRTRLILSVGSTPTAHAVISNLQPSDFAVLKGTLHGELEVHAGNYSFLDLQQLATGALPAAKPDGIHNCAMTVLSTVLSNYPGRAKDGHAHVAPPDDAPASPEDEALCDAGSIALSKDTGPLGGYGHVVWPSRLRGWHVDRVSQEHGVLALRKGDAAQWAREWGVPRDALNPSPALPHVGDKIHLVPQHACMVAAAHPWFYIVDSELIGHNDTTIVDIWVPWKGW